MALNYLSSKNHISFWTFCILLSQLLLHFYIGYSGFQKIFFFLALYWINKEQKTLGKSESVQIQNSLLIPEATISNCLFTYQNILFDFFFFFFGRRNKRLDLELYDICTKIDRAINPQKLGQEVPSIHSKNYIDQKQRKHTKTHEIKLDILFDFISK